MGNSCGCCLPAHGLQLLELSKLQRTDPNEVAALNTIQGTWGLRASKAWNISGEPCSGAADDTDVDNSPNINPGIKCDCSYNASTVCHITKLLYALNVVGQISAEPENLTYLNNLNLQQNYLTGTLPSFIGKFTSMQYLRWRSIHYLEHFQRSLGIFQISFHWALA